MRLHLKHFLRCLAHGECSINISYPPPEEKHNLYKGIGVEINSKIAFAGAESVDDGLLEHPIICQYSTLEKPCFCIWKGSYTLHVLFTTHQLSTSILLLAWECHYDLSRLKESVALGCNYWKNKNSILELQI